MVGENDAAHEHSFNESWLPGISANVRKKGSYVSIFDGTHFFCRFFIGSFHPKHRYLWGNSSPYIFISNVAHIRNFSDSI